LKEIGTLAGQLFISKKSLKSREHLNNLFNLRPRAAKKVHAILLFNIRHNVAFLSPNGYTMDMSPLSSKIDLAKQKETWLFRHEFLKSIRNFFDAKGFVEIDTPILVPNPGLEPNLEYFSTTFKPQMNDTQQRTLFLATSPEYHLKKALASGLDKIFEITSSFRNGEISPKHEPEFLMLEWYRHPGNYMDIARDGHDLFHSLAKQFSKSPEDWASPETISVCEAFQEFAAIDLESLLSENPADLGQLNLPLAKVARAAGHTEISEDWSFDDAFNALIVSKIEPALSKKKLVLLQDYPSSQAALSRPKSSKPYLCERFEIYFEGVELANAFGELTDSAEQRRRCLEDINKRKALYPNDPTPEVDESFLTALDHLDQAGGIALGIERLMMCMIGSQDLGDVRPFRL